MKDLQFIHLEIKEPNPFEEEDIEMLAEEEFMFQDTADLMGLLNRAGEFTHTSDSIQWLIDNIPQIHEIETDIDILRISLDNSPSLYKLNDTFLLTFPQISAFVRTWSHLFFNQSSLEQV